MELSKKMGIALLMFGLSANAFSDDKADLLAKIRAQAGQYNEFKELLNSPDQSLRIAAFDGMVNSGDPALRDVAIDEALANADVTMQSLAFREAIMGLDTINFAMELPDKASEKTKKTFTEWSASYNLNLLKKDKVLNTFSGGSTEARSQYLKGNVSGLELSFVSRYCNGKATLIDGSILKGILSCPKGSYPTTESIIISSKLR